MQKETNNKKSVRPVPEGFHSVTPYLIVDGAESLIEFITSAFDGKLTFISKDDRNLVTHATVEIGDSVLMISDTMDAMTPQVAMLYLYVDNADVLFKKAIEAKATPMQEPRDEFYGDRAGAVKDRWGNIWWIATHIEDISPEELDKRAKHAISERREKGKEVHA